MERSPQRISAESTPSPVVAVMRSTVRADAPASASDPFWVRYGNASPRETTRSLRWLEGMSRAAGRVPKVVETAVATMVDRITAVDQALFAKAARVGSAADVALPISRAADHALVWMAVSGAMVLTGRAETRAAAVHGLLTVAVTSAVANQVIKRAVRRTRPDRLLVPERRRAPVEHSASFPSGHAASAAAFGIVVGRRRRQLRLPLIVLASAIGSSRVLTGVHFPSDVLGGAAIGVLIGTVSSRLAPR